MEGRSQCFIWLFTGLLVSLAFLPLAVAQEYTIGPRDILSITVWGHADLSKDYPVDPDGSVPFPLIGRVKANGLTTKEFTARLRDLLEKDYLVNPQVIVAVRNTFFVLGEVKKPGAYQFDKETNILEGITIAGGFTDKAAPARTRVIRTTSKGQEVIHIDMNDIIKRGQREKAILLQENDVVVVPESFF